METIQIDDDSTCDVEENTVKFQVDSSSDEVEEISSKNTSKIDEASIKTQDNSTSTIKDTSTNASNALENLTCPQNGNELMNVKNVDAAKNNEADSTSETIATSSNKTIESSSETDATLASETVETSTSKTVETATSEIVGDSSTGVKPDTSTIMEVDNKLSSSKKIDFFDYLQRGEFSSEQFKIEIKNLPPYYGFHQLRTLINSKLELNSNKIKALPNASSAFVCFRNDEDRDNALAKLNNYSWKGCELTAIKAKPAPDPLLKKRQNESRDKGNAKKQKVDERSVEDRIKEAVTPYWNINHEEQLLKKHEEMKGIIRKIASGVSHQNPSLHTYFNAQKALHQTPCEILKPLSSNPLNGYRNKCEFTVGMNEETGLKTVGFRIGSYVDGTTGVGPVDHLLHVPDCMKVAATQLQDFIRGYPLPVYNPVDQVGVFRQLTARCTKDELMLIVGVSPKNISAETVEKLKKDLVDFFFEGTGKIANVTSLYYQPLIKKASNDDDSSAPQHLHGTTHIYETILGLKFRISPQAFFQVNTSCAETLYQAAIDMAGVTKDTTVLDVCCGTGTIGLCFAKTCGQVLGLEIIPQAIEDARRNAKENDIENAEFFVGKAEEILYSVFSRAKNEDVVAILDPPRAGLHNRAITALRKMTKLKKLVYISCNPKQAMKNFIDLGRRESKTMHGEPFVPVKAVAVDMFPHTPHCELVIYFQRVDTLPDASPVII